LTFNWKRHPLSSTGNNQSTKRDNAWSLGGYVGDRQCCHSVLSQGPKRQTWILKRRVTTRLTTYLADLYRWRFACQFSSLFTEIAIDSIQLYLIVPFVLMGRMLRRQALSRSIQTMSTADIGLLSVLYVLGRRLSVRLCPWRSRSTFLPFVIVSCSCSLWRLTLTCPASLRFFFTEPTWRQRRTTVAAVTELKRRWPRVPTAAERYRTDHSRLAPPRSRRLLRVIVDWRRRMWFDDSKSTQSNRKRMRSGTSCSKHYAEQNVSYLHRTNDVFDRCASWRQLTDKPKNHQMNLTSVSRTIRKPSIASAQTALKKINKIRRNGFSIWRMKFFHPAM